MKKSPSSSLKIWSIACFILILLLQTSCSNSRPETQIPQVTIELTEIVDKSTGQPITDNTITLRWETSNCEVLDEQVYTNQSSLSTTLLADGDKHILLKIVAPGYWPWEEAIRMKLNLNNPLYFKVKIERHNTIQV